ncbi:MAG: TspO/MBR family protein [Candidatus Nanopelagicales bacterium]
MTWRLMSSIAAVGLVVVYAVGAGLWTSANPGWYASLQRPAWQPPDLVFGLIWPYNFVALAVVGVVVTQRGSAGLVATWLAVAALSVACALAWAYLFYVPHQLTAAAVALALAAVLTVALAVLTWAVTPWGAVALVPYAIWVSLATSLAVGYSVLNS